MGIKDTSNDRDFVLNYLHQLGIKPSKNIRQFWNFLDNRHEKGILDQLDLAMKDRYEGRGTVESVYNLKNQNLLLSLDVAHFSADLYRRYFDWFMNRKAQTPKRILHIGCDNAIVTCFLGKLYPDSEIIGIDIHENAVQCAKELIRQLRLPNVTILNLDLRDLQNHFPSHSFDLIASLRSFPQVLKDNQVLPRHWSTNELLEMEITVEENHRVHRLKDLLRDTTSELITCEAFPSMGSLALWAKTLENVGLHIDWSEADHLHFHEVGEEQRLPILTASASASNHELLEQIYSFETKTKPIQPGLNETYIEPIAEILFHQIEKKDFIYGLQINYQDGSGKMRLEGWKTPDQILIYQYSNLGFRELKRFELDLLTKVKEQLHSVEPLYAPYAQTFFYESLQERDKKERAV